MTKGKKVKGIDEEMDENKDERIKMGWGVNVRLTLMPAVRVLETS